MTNSLISRIIKLQQICDLAQAADRQEIYKAVRQLNLHPEQGMNDFQRLIDSLKEAMEIITILHQRNATPEVVDEGALRQRLEVAIGLGMAKKVDIIEAVMRVIRPDLRTAGPMSRSSHCLCGCNGKDGCRL